MSKGRAAATGLSPRRQWAGVVVAVLALPAVTAVLAVSRDDISLGSVLLLYVVVVVVVSAVGGLAPGLLSAVGSFLLANFFLTPPYGTFMVDSRDSVISLLVFLVVSIVVSVLVDITARQRARAARTEAEASALGRVAAEPLTGRSARDVLAELAVTFGLDSVELRGADPSSTVLARVGGPVRGGGTVRADAGFGRSVVADGRELFAEDRRLLISLAHAAGRALDAQAMENEAARARELAQIDRLQSALLAAVSHDLRTPLSGIKAAVTTLRQDVVLADADRDELLSTVEESTDRLTDLVTNLLDLGRLRAGSFTVDLQAVPLDEVVGRALLDRHLADVRNDVPDDLPYARADAGLLERVVANLVENAHRHAEGGAVEVLARATSSRVSLEVVDHGVGVAEVDWERMFEPFQRLDGAAGGAHAGLGLAIARGFAEAMGGTLEPSPTGGGGLTMSVTLPRADATERPGAGA
jgi:K+-sensing histidine kinase KdpD